MTLFWSSYAFLAKWCIRERKFFWRCEAFFAKWRFFWQNYELAKRSFLATWRFFGEMTHLQSNVFFDSKEVRRSEALAKALAKWGVKVTLSWQSDACPLCIMLLRAVEIQTSWMLSCNWWRFIHRTDLLKSGHFESAEFISNDVRSCEGVKCWVLRFRLLLEWRILNGIEVCDRKNNPRRIEWTELKQTHRNLIKA